MVTRGEVGHVVATKLDRLFRNASDALVHVEDWNRRGVALHILQLGDNGPIVTDVNYSLGLTITISPYQRQLPFSS